LKYSGAGLQYNATSRFSFSKTRDNNFYRNFDVARKIEFTDHHRLDNCRFIFPHSIISEIFWGKCLKPPKILNTIFVDSPNAQISFQAVFN